MVSHDTMAASKRIQIRVLTSQGLAVSDEAVSLRMPGGLGPFGVLYNHAPIVSTLMPGVVQWRRADGTERRLNIGAGIAEVAKNRCTVLTAAVREAEAAQPV